MKKAWGAVAGMPRGLWTLSTATLINSAGTMALPFLVLYLSRARGFSPARAGAALAVYGAGALVAAPASGWLCDRIAPIRIVEGSLLLSGLAVATLPFLSTSTGIFSMTFVWSILAQSMRPAALAVVTGFVSSPRRKTAFSLYRLAANLGMSVGPAVGGLLATVSFPAVFLVDGATSLAAGLVLAACVRRWKDSESDDAAPPPGERRIPFRATLSDRRFLFFLAALLPVLAVFFQWMGALPLHLARDLHLSTAFYGLLFTLNTLLIVAIEVPLNVSLAGWPHGRSLALGAGLVGVGMGAMAFAGSAWSVAATTVVWTLGEMVLLPAASSFAADAAPAGRLGEYLGLYQMAIAVAFAAGPWLGTAALGRFGSTAVWSGCFAVSLASAGFLFRAGRHAAARAS